MALRTIAYAASALLLFVGVLAGALLLSTALPTRAVQNPSIAIDMDPSTNTYTPSNSTIIANRNRMDVGTTENCLSVEPGDPGLDIGNGYLEHDHEAHLVIRNVEDLVGWQARLNFIGDKLRINAFNDKPFLDQTGNVPVGFTNLPKAGVAASTHRGTVPADDIGLSPVPPDGSNTPQTVLIGSVYNGAQNFPISPDTPPKASPEPTTNASGTPITATPNYSAPTGGVLASLTLTVIGNEVGNNLFINLDDGTPHSPESNVTIWTGEGIATIPIPVNQLGDGFHGEGVACVPQDCTTPECPPTPTPTPVPTATPTPSP
jgi:hypothetical protein